MKLYRLLLLTLAAVVVSCSTADGPDDKDIMLSDFVTLVSTSQADGTVFEFQRYDDSPVVTLTAPDYSTDKVEPGQRALLYYYPESGEPYTSGRVKVRALRPITSASVAIVNLADYKWDADPVWLTSVWRSGSYLNFRLRLPWSDQQRVYGLVADETTADSPMPDLYLVHDMKGSPHGYLTDVMSSFDLTPLWSRPTCRGFVLHVDDDNLRVYTYTFEKQH